MAERLELELILKGGGKAVKSIAELEKGLEDARNEIKGLDRDSTRFKELATAIQQASSEIKTLEKEMEGLEPQQKAEAFLKMGEGIAGGFAMAQGAMALMGVESENMEKLQVKVQSAIAIAMGARMLSEGLLQAKVAKRVLMEKLAIVQGKIGTLVTKAQTLALGLWATAQGVVTGAVKVTTVAMHGLKAAITATGIGALIVGVISLYNWINTLISSVDSWEGSQQDLNQELYDTLDLQKELAAAGSELERSLIIQNKEFEDQKKHLDDLSAEYKENTEDLGWFSKAIVVAGDAISSAFGGPTVQSVLDATKEIIKSERNLLIVKDEGITKTSTQ